MREDMKYVLIERPRAGSWTRSYHDIRAAVKQTELDELPSHEGMRRPHKDRKEFTDLIGPLRRFLHSCVGRRWDEVWSEICGQLSNNTIGQHLKGHARDLVEADTVLLLDGSVKVRRRYSSQLSDPDGLYVDPRDGVIRNAGDGRRKPWKTQPDPDVVEVDGRWYKKDSETGVLYPRSRWHRETPGQFARKLVVHGEKEAVLVDGIWYWVVFEEVPPPIVEVKNGVRREINQIKWDFVTSKEARSGRYRAGKRQMSRTDLRRYGLKNTKEA